MFPHPGVRRLRDAGSPGPQRYSLHLMTPLMKGTKEREERARLKKGHRRWHSNDHQILHRGLQRSKGGSLRISISEPKHHPSPLRPPSEGENRSRGDGKISQDRTRHSQGRLDSILAAEALIEEEAAGLSRGSGSVKSRRGGIPSRPCGSRYGTPPQAVSGRWGSESHVAPGCPSPRPHKRPWVSQPSAPLPSPRYTSRPPSYSYRRQQQAAALEFHPADLKALWWSLSCGSWNMGGESGFSEGLGKS